MDFPLDYEPEIDHPVFHEELGPWLPDEIFDFHSHIFRREDDPREQESLNPSLPTVCEAYRVETYTEAMIRLFPGKRLRALLFGMPNPNADIPSANAYVADAARRHGFDALMLAGLSEDEERLEADLRAGGFVGFKPYWGYVTWKDQADVILEDMLPPGQRRLADRLGLILMVHIPRHGRLADPVNVRGIQRLCEECPRAHIILAHLGRSYFPEAIGDISTLPRYSNLSLDFSMVQDWEVCQVFIEVFGPGRLLFGLDMPVAQEKGKLVSANGQRHFFTKRIHPWSIHNSTGSYRMRCTFYAYEIIRAFKKAAERTGLTRAEIESVFSGNARRIISSVRSALSTE